MSARRTARNLLWTTSDRLCGQLAFAREERKSALWRRAAFGLGHWLGEAGWKLREES